MDTIKATLYAIYDISGEPIEDTILCPMCYTDKNIAWANLNHPSADWHDFDIDVEHKKSEYASHSCHVCGYPKNVSTGSITT
jgi:rubredoxin